MPNAPDRLLNEREVAERLGIVPSTLRVWRCTRRQSLPFIKIGRAVRYDPRAVSDFIGRHTTTPETIESR